jgi:hypothetical protein
MVWPMAEGLRPKRGPVGIAKNGHAGVCGLIFEREPAPTLEGNAKSRKEVAAYHVAFRFFRALGDAHGNFADG